MGPGFVILFWLIVAGVLGVIWLISLVIFLVGWWKKSRVLSWVGGVPLCGLTLIATLVASLVLIGFVRSSNPKSVYEDTFHEAPTPDVVGIQSDTWSFADSGHAYLRFQAGHQTFQRIRPKDLPRITYEQYRERMPVLLGDSQPSWWIPPTESTTEIYLLEATSGQGKSFSSETTMMSYDTNTSTAFYYFLGID